MIMVRVTDSYGPITREGFDTIEEAFRRWGSIKQFAESGRAEYFVTFEGQKASAAFCRWENGACDAVYFDNAEVLLEELDME